MIQLPKEAGKITQGGSLLSEDCSMYLATSFVAELGDDCDLRWRLFLASKIIPPSTRHLVCFIIDAVVQFFF